MDQAMRHQQERLSPQTDAPLERLPIDVLVLILAAARSMPDLHALFGASPVVYRVFLSAKRAVFLALLDRDLGPGLRDAIAAVLLAPAKLSEEEATCAIQQYATLPRGVGAQALARDLPDHGVFELVKTNHSVQFLIDQIVARRTVVGRIRPDAAGPLTAHERWRFAQALLRHQFLARIEPYADTLFQSSFSLWKPWEMQQLADVHCFLCNMIMLRVRMPSRNPPDQAALSVLFMASSQQEKRAVLRDIRALHRTFVEKQYHEERVQTISDELELFRHRPKGTSGLGGHFDFLVFGPLHGMASGDVVGAREGLYRREDAMPPLVHVGDHDDSSPPFGWVDAHGGLDCQRWGRDVRRKVLPPGQEDYAVGYYQSMWTGWYMDQWRWLGFVFWDKDRVELLKTQLPVYATGWLTIAPPSDAYCQTEMTGRAPPAARYRARRSGRQP